MAVSESVSLSPYLQIQDGDMTSFGGNQCWFPKDKGLFERTRNLGGCGLVSACDFVLYERYGHQPLPKDRYMDYLRKMSRFRYLVIPKVGSVSFQQPLFVNSMLRKDGRKERLHYLFANTKKKRLRIIEKSIKANHPVILVIGPHFFKPFSKKGVAFYQEFNGKMSLSTRDIFRHFVTVTGVRFPLEADGQIYLEIASWGRRYFVLYDELSDYIAKYSCPLISGIFYLR